MINCSIIICTYNRAELLSHCLRSLENQANESIAEIIVIDNNSTDNTKQITEQYQKKGLPLTYVVEKNIGLSFARNRGIAESKYQWICFLDDDALAQPDFIKILIATIESNKYDGFGGMFYPWYRTPKPKWLSSEFGKMPMLLPNEGVLPNHKYVAGGICAFNKQKVIAAGGFPTSIGMRGSVIGYGEENYLQDKMRALGFKIGFIPHWKIDHLVAEYKYTLKWQIKHVYAKGRDAQKVHRKLTAVHKLYLFFRAISVLLFHLFRFFPSLFRKNYFIQNYVIDVLRYPVRIFGLITPTK